MVQPLVSMHRAQVAVSGGVLWSEVTLTVHPGEFVAVLGANGIGKSTLLKVILGLLPARGEIEVLGRPPGKSDTGIGYLPQRRHFDSTTRIRGVDVVRFGWDGSRWGIPWPVPKKFNQRQRIADAKVAEVVALVGAQEYAHRPIGELSGGEQQRLLIAQALIKRPQLILLDEPLDSLDLPNQSSIASLINLICRTQGIGVVMVAHDVNPIASHIDRVVYLAEGKAAVGRPDEIITDESLTRLSGSPTEVLRSSTGQLVVVSQRKPDATDPCA